MKKKLAARRSVRRYRDRMRQAGFRLVQLWVPDTRSRGFRERCRKQSRAASSNAALEAEVGGWLDAVRDTGGWTA